MSSTIRDRILGSLAGFRAQRIVIDALGGELYIRPLSVRAMATIQNEKDLTRIPLILMLDCFCDETGSRLFTPADEPLLAELPGTAIETVVTAITAASQLTPETGGHSLGN